jgi:hypothetical protein
MDRLAGSPAEYFVDRYLGTMNSSFDSEDWGEFKDYR